MADTFPTIEDRMQARRAARETLVPPPPTRTPWQARHFDSKSFVLDMSEEGWVVCTASPADAELIVRAVNAHEDLLVAARALVDDTLAVYGIPADEIRGVRMEHLAALCRAIAKAGDGAR